MPSRHRAPALLLTLSVGTAISGRAEMPVDEDAIRAEMEALRAEGDQVSQRARERAVELARKAVAAHDRGDYERARELHLEAIERLPFAPSLRYELAFTLSAMGRPLEALDQVVRGLLLDPDNEDILMLEATLLDDLGEVEESLRAYRDLLSRHPDSYLGHVNLGITLSRLERWEEAEEALLRAGELRPTDPLALFHRARLARLRGRFDEEATLLARYLELFPEDPRAAAVAARLDEVERSGGEPGVDVVLAEPPFADDLLGENLPAAVLAAADSSSLAYAVDVAASPDDATSFSNREARRFRKGLELPAVDVVDCDAAADKIASIQDSYAWDGVEARIARCFLPDEKPWKTSNASCSRVAKSLRDLAPRLPVAIDRNGDRIAVELLADARNEWLFLRSGQGRLEVRGRRRARRPRDDRPSVDEEVFAFQTLAQAVANAKAERPRTVSLGARPGPRQPPHHHRCRAAARLRALRGDPQDVPRSPGPPQRLGRGLSRPISAPVGAREPRRASGLGGRGGRHSGHRRSLTFRLLWYLAGRRLSGPGERDRGKEVPCASARVIPP
ncbi:MAG: tetratricopeptide repeat protein [Thermoanaerobaculia bacterium]